MLKALSQLEWEGARSTFTCYQCDLLLFVRCHFLTKRIPHLSKCNPHGVESFAGEKLEELERSPEGYFDIKCLRMGVAVVMVVATGVEMDTDTVHQTGIQA
ncbi:hypothetical protein Trydic_g14134 [Trypoxylus dichotomus]